MTKRVFEKLDETEIELINGALRITQTDRDDCSYVVEIPGRYIREFLDECERVALLAD